MKQRIQTLDDFIKESKVDNEDISIFKPIVQNALLNAGYKLKQNEFKISIKNDGTLGKKIYLNDIYLGNHDCHDVMVAKFTEYIKDNPEKYSLVKLHEDTLTSNYAKGTYVNINNIEGIITDITMQHNKMVFQFEFEDANNIKHTAINIGDKFILKESASCDDLYAFMHLTE